MFKLSATLISLAIFASSITAQTKSSGTLLGTVTDSAGAVVSGAEIKLSNSLQIVVSVTQSDVSGRFRFDNIPVASYVIFATRTGFSSKTQVVRIEDNRPAEIGLLLSVNELTEEVTVTADTGQTQERNKIPQQINIIPQDAISLRATGVLAQVADEETGVSLQRTSPTIGAVLVRGLTEVGVYVDGVRYTNSTQRGGINTFFNLNEPTALQSVEIQRSPNTAQFGSDGLGGNVQLISRQPQYGLDKPKWNGELNSFFGSTDRSFGANGLLTYGAKKYGLMGNIVGRRVNTLRPGGGVDSHSSITRFLGLPSNTIGSNRLTDTAFSQYGATFHANYAPSDDQNLSFRYQRSQQDGGKRYDQLLGGDGNLIAELKNLMLDFGYLRYLNQGFGFLDNFSVNVSFNSQREERVNQGGQGNPLATITNDKERTSTWGTAFYLDKRFHNNSFLFGGDYYHDKVSAPSFNTNPANGTVTLVRPRVPNGAVYHLGGVYIQDVFEPVNERVRISGSLRYNVASYRSRAANSPTVNGNRLFPDDSARFADLSGRIGGSVTLIDGLNAAFNYSRGFRAPNITSLGALGLAGVGYQVSTTDVAGLGATVGNTADGNAESTDIAVAPLRSEISDNFDVSIRYRNRRFEASLTGFVTDYRDAIVRQTLILPQGAVGTMLGSQMITNQNANGAVFVPASISPVLIQANFGDTRMKGTEFNFESRIGTSWTVAGNHSYVFAEDKQTGLPPNLGGGGIPPQFGFLRVRYQPPAKNYWVEAYTNVSGRQDRLSTLDISDRRTGAARSRAQIQNFFHRGACVRGLTTVGSNGQCGTAGGVLVATGETLVQVQNRMMSIGAVVNGVRIVDENTSVPLFSAIPGYGLFNIRGGYRFDEKHAVTIDFANIADKSHRAPGWGIDGPGRSLTVKYNYRF